jgi:hypothetical protein
LTPESEKFIEHAKIVLARSNVMLNAGLNDP